MLPERETPRQVDVTSLDEESSGEVIEVGQVSDSVGAVEDKEDQARNKLEQRLIGFLDEVYDQGDDNDDEKRVDIIFKKLEPFLNEANFTQAMMAGKDLEKIIADVKQAVATRDKEEFLKVVAKALKPIIDIHYQYPEELEKVSRQNFVEQSGFTSINEILSYEVSNQGEVNFHLAPARAMKLVERMLVIKTGLNDLAKIVEQNQDIKVVVATSWIVAKNPKIFTSLGFTIEGEIDDETRKRHFQSEERPVARAVMTREEFLKKYL